jgi:DNA-binding transcriptional ArsR family regulator
VTGSGAGQRVQANRDLRSVRTSSATLIVYGSTRTFPLLAMSTNIGNLIWGGRAPRGGPADESMGLTHSGRRRYSSSVILPITRPTAAGDCAATHIYNLTSIYFELHTDRVDEFAAIADGTRRRILDRLRAGESDVSGLIETLGLPQPLVSKHLRVLREAGVVTAAVAGNRRVYRLADETLADVLGWVTPYYRLWTSSLDRLAAVLDEEAEGR